MAFSRPPHPFVSLGLGLALACGGLAACGDDKQHAAPDAGETVGGIPCQTADDCAGKIEVAQCQQAICNEAKLCATVPVQDGTRCGDGLACTHPDYCLGGVCYGAPLVCDDEDPCTQNNCDNKSGCFFTPLHDGPCDDHDPCTVGDACHDGVCGGGERTPGCCRFDPECNDDDPCTDDHCSDNACTHTFNYAPCNDKNPCTLSDHCNGAGACGGDELPCDDGNPCTLDKCNPATGQCEATPVDDGTACEDGNPCSIGDVCENSRCVAGPNACECTTDLDCAAHEDLDLCNGTLVCVTLHCVVNPLTIIACNPTGDTACVKSTCDPRSGQCVPTPVPDGTSCDDQNVCSTGDVCTNGLCLGDPPSCDDGNPCTFDACSPVNGCVHTPNTLPCDDLDACTQNDQCSAGACQGQVISCDDHNPCTDDSCSPRTGCVSTPNTNACDDNNACTSQDHCAAGACVPGVNICQCTTNEDCAAQDPGDNCNGHLACGADHVCHIDPATATTCPPPTNPCMRATCDALSGHCAEVPANDGATCNDQDGCTTSDTCQAGVCRGVAKACDDGNPCTLDSCEAGACKTAPAFEGQPCADDGNVCTSDVCVNGACGHPAVANGKACAADTNVCTQDVCVDGACGHPPVANGLPCADDGNVCTYDQCKTGACVHVSNDPAPVTAEQCFPVKELKANTGRVTGAWTDCGVADQFNYSCQGPNCTHTGAITNWACADPAFYYMGGNTGYEYTYAFVAPADGTCTFVEYEEGIKVQGKLFGVIDWFILQGGGQCDATDCLDYVWENKTGDAICGGGQKTCSYKEFPVTAGELFYVVADIYDGTTSGGHQSYKFPPGWTIEMKCKTGSTLLLNEDFSDAVCSGCTLGKTGGAGCTDFGWHYIGGLTPSPGVTVTQAYYIGDLKNGTLAGYDCGAQTATMQFPAVTLPATATACSVSFDLYSDLDATDNGSCTNDTLAVRLVPVAGGAAQPVTGATCAAHTAASNPIGFETTPTVTTMRYDISAWKGQSVKLDLLWSANATNNLGLGAVIDNVMVRCDTP